MRLEWLEDLLAVAETGSLQEAAERRRLTQSAFSRRIQQIESHVGVELFDRSRKPVQLRPTLHDQRDRIGALAKDLRQLVFDLRRGDRASANRITFASQHALTTAFAPSILEAIHARHANVYVRLRSANLDECFGLLLSRQADIALVYRLPGEDHPIKAAFIEAARIGGDLLVPVIARARAEAVAAQISAGELPYVAYPGEVFFGRVMERFVLPRIGTAIRPLPKVETALTLAALEMALLGVAVAWVPASLARARIGDGALADLSAMLPAQALDVTAVRLLGNAGDLATLVWLQIVA